MLTKFSDTILTHIYGWTDFVASHQKSCKSAKQNAIKQHSHKNSTKSQFPINQKNLLLNLRNQLKKDNYTEEIKNCNKRIPDYHCVLMRNTEAHLCTKYSSAHQSPASCKVKEPFLPFYLTFFKIVLFFFLFNNITVSATPISKHIAMMSLRKNFHFNVQKDEVLYRGPRSIETAILQARNRYHNSREESTNEYSRLLVRKSRSSSQNKCMPQLDRIIRLLQHTHAIANEEHSQRRRSASRMTTSRGNFCTSMYTHIQKTICDVRKIGKLLPNSGDDVANTLDSVIGMLQQDMNKLNIGHPPVPTCHDVPNGDRPTDIVRRVLHDMYNIEMEFRYMCRTSSRSTKNLCDLLRIN